ncbi:hypothetical protein HNQ50_001539 [Silvimonas terrae]|uniref:Uncharacterized protein n=1 Tax=Silvimonas terrae TaxID=300266 RepID=A0A840REH6_9NEIS|nr:hypothetical protein [Silvimonas terrae]
MSRDIKSLPVDAHRGKLITLICGNPAQMAPRHLTNAKHEKTPPGLRLSGVFCGHVMTRPDILVGPPGVEPGTNGLCLPATAFAAPFGFVVWTVSCLYDLPVQSLHVPATQLAGFARDYHGVEVIDTRGFPEFEQFYQRAELTCPKATHTTSSIPCRLQERRFVKSAALTRHELEAHIKQTPGQ